MIVPFNVRDFLDRAESTYPGHLALVDEPEQPTEPWPDLTFAELASRARRQAAGLDRLGVGPGERVAVVSPNAARLLTCFFGVCGFGRILVPINFRLSAEEVEFIVEHAEAAVLLVDPELEEAL
ncbi:MAG TPA: AMP-binding protein, partial [Acidimicrobiales bacterium]|nr:AMP-binding protein [Acidimicrobiales bacterium]